MKRILMSVVLTGALVVPAAFTQEREREANQKARSKEGVASGEITKKEAAGLAHDQRKINRQVNKAKADGVVTPHEKAKITREQNAESKKIYKDKHNAEKQQ
jgi:hypothetical protein